MIPIESRGLHSSMSKVKVYPEIEPPAPQLLFAGEGEYIYDSEPTLYGSVYTCPEGKRAYVESILVHMDEDPGTTDPTFNFYLMFREDSSGDDYLLINAELEPLLTYRYDLNLTLEEGDSLSCGSRLDADKSYASDDTEVLTFVTGIVEEA